MQIASVGVTVFTRPSFRRDDVRRARTRVVTFGPGGVPAPARERMHGPACPPTAPASRTEKNVRAAVVTSFDAPLVLEDRPIPVPGPGEVLVRIEATGLCHTDIHA